MRRRFKKLLPVVLLALAMQILAPIAACWATAIAASDPLGAAEICRPGAAHASGQQGDQGGDQRTHDGVCAVCCVLHAGVSIDTPQVAAFATPYRKVERVVWRNHALDLSVYRTGSNSQARAPPPAI